MRDGSPAVAASYFIRLRLDESSVDPAYLWAAMNSTGMKRRLFAMARGAIGQANINARELKSIPLPVPPLDLQCRYAEIVEAAALARPRGGVQHENGCYPDDVSHVRDVPERRVRAWRSCMRLRHMDWVHDAGPSAFGPSCSGPVVGRPPP